ncbi:MAG: SLC13 family permease, partial [Bacteroidota bacterium]
ICWWYLTRIAFFFPSGGFSGGRDEIRRLQREQGPMARQEKLVLLLFTVTAVAWIIRKPILAQWFPYVNDTVIAILAASLLFLIPGGKGRGLLTWREAVKLPWGVVLLLGGGFALADGFEAAQLADYVAANVSVPAGIGLFVVILVVVTAVNFLTEVTSNVATTSMLMPVLAAAALPIGIHPYALMVPATLAATCAFMLPVATPPNAVVFGSGYLQIPDMVRAGFRMNIISILIITLVCYLVLPLLWGFSPDVLPDWVGD